MLKQRYDKFISLYGKTERPSSSYYEKHHIIPKEFGGSNNSENLCFLTRKQHLYAHKELSLNRSTIRRRIARGMSGWSYLV